MALFAFDSKLDFPWKLKHTISIIQSYLEVYWIVPYLQYFSLTSYIIIFFMGVLIVTIQCALFGYISYTFQKKKTPFQWSLQALRLFLNCTMTVFFVPLLTLFLSMNRCKKYEEKTELAHEMF